MKPYVILTPAPTDEPTTPMTDPLYSYKIRMELRAHIKQIIRLSKAGYFGKWKPSNRLRIISSTHELGIFLELVLEYNEDDPESFEYVKRFQNKAPRYWDDESRTLLCKWGYFNEL